MKRFERLFAFILALCLFGASVGYTDIHAEEKDGDDSPIIVIAGSDFQAQTPEYSSDNTRTLLNAIKLAGYSEADGFLFAGDYNNEYDDKSDEIALLKSTVKDVYPSLADDRMVFVQGNHDPAGSVGLSKYGGNDTDDYGVYVINEDNYMLNNSSPSVISNAAAHLEKYLKAKVDEGYSKPVFVVSHLPLHYSYRTINIGDAQYAVYLFDVLNKYAEKLNIIFMFGHNHSAPFDDYIGGSMIYLSKGDKIYIAKEGKPTEVPDEYTLNFTYMNAGYVGYTYCLNNMLTMTVFEIVGNTVKVKRVSAGGVCDLKTEGSWSSSYEESASTYGAQSSYLNTAYGSPQYIGNSATDGDITVYAEGISGISVSENKNATVKDVQTAYISYDITVTGEQSGRAAVIIEPGRSFIAARPIFIRDKSTNEIICRYIENGRIVFETDKISSYELAQHKSVLMEEYEANVFEYAAELVDGNSYLILSKSSEGKAYALSHSQENGLSATETEVLSGFGTTFTYSENAAEQWKFIYDENAGHSSVMGSLINAESEYYLTAPEGTTLAASAEKSESYSDWRLSSGSYGIFAVTSAEDTATRYYMKHKNGFTVSDSTESSFRVYAFEQAAKNVRLLAYIDSAFGGVALGSESSAITGGKIYLIGTDGSEQIIDIDASMLKTADGKAVDTSAEGVYTELTVNYNGKEIYDGYTLFVGRDVSYPEPYIEGEESIAEESVDENGGGDDGISVTVWVVIGVAAVACAVIAVIAVKRKKH